MIQKSVFSYAGISVFELTCIAAVYTQALLHRRRCLVQIQGAGLTKIPTFESRYV